MGERIALTVNGTPRELEVEPRRLLVQALREDMDLTGTHVGRGGSAAATAAAERATDGQTVNGDIHADRDYRARMAVVYTRRAVEAALGH